MFPTPELLNFKPMEHRGLLLGFACALLAVGTAAAQEGNPTRRQTRQADPNAAFMGGGMVVEAAPVLGRRPQQVTTRTEIAPMPNFALEAPRGFSQVDAARLTPGMIAPALPGRGSAQVNGSPGSLQERLFRPAPGAYLRIPMTW